MVLFSGRRIVDASGAPAAVGSYSHAVAVGGLLFCSGQIALDSQTGELVGANAAEQAEQCLRNLMAVCDSAGTSLSQAVRLTLYLVDMAASADVNTVYTRFFPTDPPARITVGVSELPKGALIEIDAVVAV